MFNNFTNMENIGIRKRQEFPDGSLKLRGAVESRPIENIQSDNNSNRSKTDSKKFQYPENVQKDIETFESSIYRKKYLAKVEGDADMLVLVGINNLWLGKKDKAKKYFFEARQKMKSQRENLDFAYKLFQLKIIAGYPLTNKDLKYLQKSIDQSASGHEEARQVLKSIGNKSVVEFEEEKLNMIRNKIITEKVEELKQIKDSCTNLDGLYKIHVGMWALQMSKSLTELDYQAEAYYHLKFSALFSNNPEAIDLLIQIFEKKVEEEEKYKVKLENYKKLLSEVNSPEPE